MPHYKDGTPAKEGDKVIGTGYNEKNGDGSPRVIVGTVVAVNTGETCNVQVLHTKVDKMPTEWNHPQLRNEHDTHRTNWLPSEGVAFFCTYGDGRSWWWRTYTTIEYGQANSFDLVKQLPKHPSAEEWTAMNRAGIPKNAPTPV